MNTLFPECKIQTQFLDQLSRDCVWKGLHSHPKGILINHAIEKGQIFDATIILP